MKYDKVPILDLQPQIQALWEPLNSAIQNVLKSGHFIMGPQVKTLETELAQYLKVKHAIGVNSGTDALVIGLRALGVGPGDEVITTPFTFFATAEAISQLGAKPVFVDINPKTYNLDVTQIEAKITSKTKAILPVHLYGQPADMKALMDLARQRNLKVLEDVAQACGGTFGDKMLGTIGEVGAFSFFPSKNLGGFGDGGFIATNDDSLAETCRMLRVHGSRKKYFNEVVGYNSRLDEIQAAVLRVKLPHLDQWNSQRRRVALTYNKLFQAVPGVVTPYEEDFGKSVYHQYTIRVPGPKRNPLQERLAQKGITTMLYYPVPLHTMAMYKDTYVKLPETEKACEEVISLPIWPEMSDDMIQYVVNSVRDCLA